MVEDKIIDEELALSADVLEEDVVVGRKVGIALASCSGSDFLCDLQPLGEVARFLGCFNLPPLPRAVGVAVLAIGHGFVREHGDIGFLDFDAEAGSVAEGQIPIFDPPVVFYILVVDRQPEVVGLLDEEVGD